MWMSSVGQTKNGSTFTGSPLDSVCTQPLEFASATFYMLIDTSLVSSE